MIHNKLIQLARYSYWDKEIGALIVDAKHLKLTVSQRKLLGLLVENLNRPVHGTLIFDEVNYSLDKEFNEKSVRNLISSLRKFAPMIKIVNIYGGYYMLRKDSMYPDLEFKDYLYEVLDQSKNAIVITNPNEYDNPIIYVNSAFSELFEYTFEDVMGKNCRFLHDDDIEQLAIDEIRKAIQERESITVNLRNYTQSGKILYNEVTISPIFDKKNGKLKYFLGVHKDVTFIKTLMRQLSSLH